MVLRIVQNGIIVAEHVETESFGCDVQVVQDAREQFSVLPCGACKQHSASVAKTLNYFFKATRYFFLKKLIKHETVAASTKISIPNEPDESPFYGFKCVKIIGNKIGRVYPC